MSIKLMLAHNYTDQNIIGWHMSEKLDGIRAYWNGECFYSRTGKEIKAPKLFINNMPKGLPLDGELCVGRGKFNETSSIVRKTSRRKESIKSKNISRTSTIVLNYKLFNF